MIKSDKDNSPKILLKGAALGSIKDPGTCNEITWKKGTDPDCRQFYDKDGAVYYNYYSQTISSDLACTLMRKSNSSDVDCNKTGGQFVAETKDCMYLALPAESNTCSAQAGGCRAYMGPTGRNAVAVLFEQFNDPNSLAKFAFDKPVKVQLSKESVLVGDQSIKVEAGGVTDMDLKMVVPISTTSTLYRISFWVKTDNIVAENANVSIDGQIAGSFVPDVKWKRFEFGPFAIKGTAQGATTTAQIAWHFPAGFKAAYLDTIRLDQLNDTQFVIKDKWSIPAACDATYPENIPEPHAMAGCRAYTDRDGNTAFVRKFSSLCREQAIGCKSFIDTRGNADPYPKTASIAGTAGPSKKGNDKSNNPADLKAKAYDEQFLGDWSETTDPFRYYYAIDDERAQCDSAENMCRAFGKPVFMQTGLSLATTTYAVRPQDADIYNNQKQVQGFQTVLLKHDFDSYADDSGNLKLACRKDELFCNRFQSGNVTEYFRDPGQHACVWQKAVQLQKNEAYNIMQDGVYSGWFRKGTSIPCYPEYLGSGESFMLQFTGELRYAGWGAECPQDQSECAEFVDPNDSSDPSKPDGKSYFMINSNRLDTSSCGGVADPLSGCVLFNNKNISETQASSKATYAKIEAEHGAAQSPVDCDKDKENPYCTGNGRCRDFVKKYRPQQSGESDALYKILVVERFEKLWSDQFAASSAENRPCQASSQCSVTIMDGQVSTVGTVEGTCKIEKFSNDSNLVLKVKMERECARWMGCRTGETVYDPSAQKFVNQCSQLELCEKNGSRNEDIFCAKFTDRSKEDLLKAGQFLTPELYSGRPVGYGTLDYSGYTTPNQYLLPDIYPKPVGYQILTGSVKNNYRYDNRLTADLPINSSIILEDDPNFKSLPSGVKLCKDLRTGQTGYSMAPYSICTLAISGNESLTLVSGGKGSENISKNIQQIYKEFTGGDTGRGNALLQTSMPSPECQLYPEVSSPLTNEYVEKWNENSVPPSPKTMMPGYEGAKACIFGEDCSCSYRKVRYEQNIERYYELSGMAPSVGVCIGGKNDGSSCVPGGYIPVDGQNRMLISMKAGSAKDSCDNGTCASIQDVVVQNGRYAYCLERDKTRTSDVAKSLAPCLTWSPSGVLGGKFDLTHYSPTAGYLPPQGAGEYFCISGANQQKIETPSTVTYALDKDPNLASLNFKNPGQLLHFEFSRPNVWWNVADKNKYSNKSIEGVSNVHPTPEGLTGGNMQNLMSACRRTSLCEGYPINENVADNLQSAPDWLDFNEKEGRWIMTGSAFNQSYMEYFIPYRSSPDKGFFTPDADALDFKFGLFRFRINPYAAGVACKWNPGWLGMAYPTASEPKTLLDGLGKPILDSQQKEEKDFSCEGYLSQVSANSNSFSSQFSQSFPGVLDRTSERVYANEQGTPIQLGCMQDPENKKPCYYKYWETGYRYDNSQTAFQWRDKTINQFMPQEQTLFNLRQKSGQGVFYATECSASNPYFAIRAMFQNMNDTENSMSPDQAGNIKLSGPWQFAGFWITTCLPQKKSGDPGWLYLQLDVVKTDVCREVGQVVSPNTRESAAFADRVWYSGKFLVPILGLTYDSRNSPFGSALATGLIGHDPMIMGASIPLSGRTGSSPSFVDSGVGLQTVLMDQQSAWAPLTNLFAKVYKIYRWETDMVGKDDWVCVTGVNQGKKCAPNSNHAAGLTTCSGYATCDPKVDSEVKNQNWRCNTLSGVNRGMHCGDESPRNTDANCHNAPMIYYEKNDDTGETVETRAPMYTTCGPKTGPWNTAFTLKASQLSDLGLCKVQSCSSYGASTWPNPHIDTFPGVCPGGEYDRMREDAGKIAGNTPGSNQMYSSSCLYKEADDENGPQIKFKVDRCPNNPSMYYAYPDKASLSSVNDIDSVLPVIFALAQKASVNAKANCGVDIKGSTETNLLDLMSGETSVSIASYIRKIFPGKFPDSQFIQPALIDGLRYYWSTKGLDDTLYSHAADLTVNLGPYNQNNIENIAIFQCTPSAANPGARCALPSDKSMDCPLSVIPCPGVSSPTNFFDLAGQTTPNQVPTCGYCTVNATPAVQETLDPYVKMPQFKGTGYCQGYNKLSRCKTNNDCRFSAFEFWGAHDDGSATGKIYGAGELRLMYSQDDKADGKDFTASVTTKNRKLPTPLFDSGVMTEVDDKYSEPAVLTSYGETPPIIRSAVNSTGYGAKISEDLITNNLLVPEAKGMDALCPIKPWLDLCVDLLQNKNLINIFFNGLAEKKDILSTCLETCNQTALAFPSSYAQYLDKIAGANRAAAEKPEKWNYRMAAVAPFAVNPLARELQSIGIYLFTSQYNSSLPVYGAWIQGLWYTVADTTLPAWLPADITKIKPFTVLQSWGLSQWFNKLFLDTRIYKEIIPNFDLAKPGGNSVFPWGASHLFFTTIFPLAVKTDYEVLSPKTRDYTQGSGFGGFKFKLWESFIGMWSGYGYSSELNAKFETVLDTYLSWYAYYEDDIFRNIADDDHKLQNCGGVPEFSCPRRPEFDQAAVKLDKAISEYKKQYKVDMKDNYFDWTGWGIFMNRNNPQLQLYPGASLAASNNTNLLYDVFVPGHCEPPAGGTDSDSVKGKYGQVRLVSANVPDSMSGLGVKRETPSEVLMPWISGKTYLDNVGNMVDQFDTKDGLAKPDSWDWIPSYVIGGGDSQVLMPGPVGDMNKTFQTCRCIGGQLDGQVVETESQCNPQIKADPGMDPAKYAKDDLTPDWQFCKPATAYGAGDNYLSYADVIKQAYSGKTDTVTNKPYSIEGYSSIGEYTSKIKAGEPIPECVLNSGNPDSLDPDLDNNSCTHRPGYLPRGDVCKDGRDACLFTYDLTNKYSVNNKSVKGEFILSATDVTNGLDTFKYISGGNRNMSGQEYMSWYRPLPPRVAAPNANRAAQSANAQSVGALDTFSLDNKVEGLVYYGGGQGLATMRFFAWAAHEQSPIKNIVIDWGDGSVQEISNGQMKNQKPVCNTDRECEFVPGLACNSNADCPPGTGACLQMGNCSKQAYKVCHKDQDCGASDTCSPRIFFGNSNDACRQGFFEFVHVYKCDTNQLLSAVCDEQRRCEHNPDVVCSVNADCRPNEKCVMGLSPMGGCLNSVLNRCRYTPRVMVMDNWGWCTGDCTQKGEEQPGGAAVSREKLIRHPNGGCWDGSQTKINYEEVKQTNSATLSNECSSIGLADKDLTLWQKLYRPWAMFNGSVEVGYSETGPLPIEHVYPNWYANTPKPQINLNIQ
ncbi:MAG: hypothetical protein WCW31_05125 [Patescibacteria group bacterium]